MSESLIPWILIGYVMGMLIIVVVLIVLPGPLFRLMDRVAAWVDHLPWNQTP